MGWKWDLGAVSRLDTEEIFASQEGQDMVLVSVGPSCLTRSRVWFKGWSSKKVTKNHGLPDVDMNSGMGNVLGASVTTFPCKPKNGPKPIPMKIQANFRFRFSPNLRL